MFSGPITAARALLPWWIPWANLFVAIPAAALIAGVSTWVTAAIAIAPLRRAEKAGALASEERVRLQYPYTRSVGRNRIAASILIPLSVALFGDDLAYVSRSGLIGLTAVVAIFVSGWVARRLRPFEVVPRPKGVQRWKALGFLAIWFCRLPLVLAMLLMTKTASDVQTWLVIASCFAAFVAFWFGGMTWLMRVTHVVRPGPPRLLTGARVAAERNSTPLPAVFEIDLPIANAFAFPTSHAIVATRGLLDLLDDAELASVCTHEAAHLTEGPWMVAGRHAGDIALIVLGLSPLVVDRTGLLTAVAGDFAVVVVAALLVKLVASHGERRADAIAHRAEPLPDVYLRALEKLHRVNGVPLALSKRGGMQRGVLRRLFGSGGSHGSFTERAVALGAAVPSDAKPPSRARTLSARLAGAGVGAIGTVGVVLLSFLTSTWSIEEEGGDRMVALALGGNVGYPLAQLAAEAIHAGRVDDAVKFLAARAEIEPDSPDAQLDVAALLAYAGRTAEIRIALARANELLDPTRPPSRRGLSSFLFEAVPLDEEDYRAHLEKRAQEIGRQLRSQER